MVIAVRVSTARFAPSIMTPSVRMGLGPSASEASMLNCGESKPPPYGTNTARFAPSIMTPTLQMGLGPSAL